MTKFCKPALPLSHPATLIATWGGSGLLRPAPGTWGSLAALPFAWAITFLGGPIWLTLATVFVFALGWWAAQVYEQADGDRDPGTVVIDEVAGQWLCLVPAATDLPTYLIGFLAFRLADIAKPWPARWCDRHIGGGLGIMLDDVVAGLYAMAVVLAWQEWGPEGI